LFEKKKISVVINKRDDDTRSLRLDCFNYISLHLEFRQKYAFKENPKIEFGRINHRNGRPIHVLGKNVNSIIMDLNDVNLLWEAKGNVRASKDPKHAAKF
jgi:hypothetical protein